jgi:trigger factor
MQQATTQAVETLSQLERRLNMAVPVADIDREVEQRLRQLSRTVRMPGFRPGKVPMKIVAQQYGPQVRSEVLSDAVQKGFSQAVQDQNLRVAGYPRIEPKQGETAADKIEFSATFEVYPDVKLGDISAVAIERPVMPVTDAEVDRTIEILRKQRVHHHETDRAAAKDDKVTVDFVGTVDGVEFAGGKGNAMPFVIGEGRMLPEFEAGVTGMKAGEIRAVAVTFPADYHGKDVAGKTASFSITVKTVEEPHLPDVDAEFAKSLGVEDGDLDKMRVEVKANVEREVKKRLQSNVKQKVMQALVDSSQLEMPKSLVEMEVERLIDQTRQDLAGRGMKVEDMPFSPDLFQEQAKRRVALGLILSELIKQHSLGAKPEQVRALVDEHAQSYEDPAEVVKWFYSQPQRLAEFEGLAVEENVVQWALASAKVTDKPMAFAELMGAGA